MSKKEKSLTSYGDNSFKCINNCQAQGYQGELWEHQNSSSGPFLSHNASKNSL